MNRLFITVLIGLLGINNSFGQIQNEVNKILKKKDFVALKKYVDNLSNQDKDIGSHWECLRDLTNDYKEGVLIFQISASHNDNPAISTVHTYKVTIITTETTIVQYELSERKSKKVGNDWEIYFDPIDKFKDEKALAALKISFKSIFHTELNEDELFITDFVYGDHCGIAGVSPQGRKQVEIFVAKKNKNELLKWLQSTNTEKQVYAVDGLYQLKKLGIEMTGEELKTIRFIINKSGTMYVCSGCFHNREKIKSVTRKFKF